MSAYGRLHELKIREKDYVLSCEQTRQQLSQYIDEQAKRVNIDSAKKRAVVQHMDYEGFRQMVLAANIFVTKSSELFKFSKGESGQMSMNKEYDQKKSQNSLKSTKYEEQVQSKSEMHCTSFRQFKKKFMANFPNKTEEEKNNQKIQFCYNLVKQQNEERLRKIFNNECEGTILVKIVDIFQAVLTQMRKREQREELQNQGGFMLLFFRMISSIPTMAQMTLLILSKKQKMKISDFIVSLKEVVGANVDEEIQRVSKIFAK